MPGCWRWSRPPTECVSTPSPREPSASLHNGRKMPMEECKRSVLEAIKAGYPVFEHRDLANICETTVLACCIPAFLDKLKNPAYTYNVGRVFGNADILSLGNPVCFKNKKTLPIRHYSSKQSWYSLRSSSTRSMGNLSPQPGCSMSHEHISCTSTVAFPL